MVARIFNYDITQLMLGTIVAVCSNVEFIVTNIRQIR